MNQHDAHYLTLITSPASLSRKELAGLLHSEAGMDARTIEMRLGRTPPCILGLYDPRQCLAATRTILNQGGDAFSCSMDDISSLGPTHKIRDFELKQDGIHVTLWRAGVEIINPDDLHILIRAKLSEQKTTSPSTAIDAPHWIVSGNRRHTGISSAQLGAGFGLGGAYGLALSVYRMQGMSDYANEKTMKTSDKLDLHLKDGRVFQIDGDKFGFGILGEQRGLSDNENIDKMCELLAHLAPEAIVDPYFSLWKPPARHQQLRLPGMKINNEEPAFAFYSRWAALMYRHVSGS
ncbi:MAG: hypothetical protein O7G85_09670 [Planctomycetota bacterium]|nr:hypothetical protein [Planctomycetota bacterium]